jgi:16S rRNA (cytosine967-C5)-methyltransferase
MVNGILRSYLRRREELTLPADWEELRRLSVQYSHPRWLVEAFWKRLGPGQTEALLAANNGQPPITVQVNTAFWSGEQVRATLEEDGVQVEPHPSLPGCLQLRETGNLERLRAFEQGMLFVQDGAARLAVSALELRPGQRVLDCCASPGGKSFAAAVDMKNRGQVISCDIYPHKLPLMTAGRDRLGLSIVSPTLQDASAQRAEWLAQFDAVVCDVPCSGLGIIRKKPDIRYKDPGELEQLPALQRRILEQGCRYVKPGGSLLYATCTLMEAENERVVEDFWAGHPEFEPQTFVLPGLGQFAGMATLWPHLHDTDGFFISVMKRVR